MKPLRLIHGIILLLTVMTTAAAVGQTVTGSITGEVTDPSGAVISGAQVVAHNLDTGVDSPTRNRVGFLSDRFPAHRSLSGDGAGVRLQQRDCSDILFGGTTDSDLQRHTACWFGLCHGVPDPGGISLLRLCMPYACSTLQASQPKFQVHNRL